jgi:hypothetical protein
MPENTAESHQLSDLNQRSLKPDEVVTSANLPKNVSLRLYELMTKVVSEEVTPATVNAACNCATEITKLLKLNIELKRSGL